MGQHREFLADEITMMQSDNAVLRQENDLLRMTSERKAQENEMLKEELIAVRAAYATKIDEAAALRTILEGIGQHVSAGITRFMERRHVKQAHVETAVNSDDQRNKVVASYREEQRSDQGASAYAPPPRGSRPEPVSTDAPPVFLRQGSQMKPISDSRIPMAPMSDEERSEAMQETLNSRSTMR